jgi:hypothetical protein
MGRMLERPRIIVNYGRSRPVLAGRLLEPEHASRSRRPRGKLRGAWLPGHRVADPDRLVEITSNSVRAGQLQLKQEPALGVIVGDRGEAFGTVCGDLAGAAAHHLELGGLESVRFGGVRNVRRLEQALVEALHEQPG